MEIDIMKTTAIIANPRINGNCDQIVSKIAENLDGEVNKYYLNKLDIQYCNACDACEKGDCVKDDDIRKIIDEMQESDRIIFASPIYYDQVSAQAKTLIDRLYQIAKNPNKSMEGKKAILVFTHGHPGDVFDSYIETVKFVPFQRMGMEVVKTIIARGATFKGVGIEDALKEAENIEI